MFSKSICVHLVGITKGGLEKVIQSLDKVRLREFELNTLILKVGMITDNLLLVTSELLKCFESQYVPIWWALLNGGLDRVIQSFVWNTKEGKRYKNFLRYKTLICTNMNQDLSLHDFS